MRPDAPERFALLSAAAFATSLPRSWVTLDQFNAAALRASWRRPTATGRRPDAAGLIRSLDHMVAGHVLAYEAVKALEPAAAVTLRTRPIGVYELDGLLVDILRARAVGLDRHDLGPWLAARRVAFHATTAPPWGPLGHALRVITGAAMALHRALPRAVAAVYASPHESTLDGAG